METKRGQIQNAKDGFSFRPEAARPYGLRRVEVKNEHGAAKAKWEGRIRRRQRSSSGYMTCTATAADIKAIAQGIEHGVDSLSVRITLEREHAALYFAQESAGISWPADLWARKGEERIRGRKYVPKDEWTINRDAWEAIITEESGIYGLCKK